ncbi:hypothetical protein [Lentibacillus amyloliquefaciens]|nr:hypothetical protein [Lentibacillus amyloliquefaciens]
MVRLGEGSTASICPVLIEDSLYKRKTLKKEFRTIYSREDMARWL